MASYSVLPVKTHIRAKHLFTESKDTCCGGCTYNNFWKVFVNLLHKVQKVMNLRRQENGNHINSRENVQMIFLFQDLVRKNDHLCFLCLLFTVGNEVLSLMVITYLASQEY